MQLGSGESEGNVTADQLKQKLDYDEFRFVRHGVERAVSPSEDWAKQVVRGAIRTPSGDKIPARVVLHPAKQAAGCSHVGEVTIPPAWLDEFREEISRFFFRSEDGECFSQIQVLEEIRGEDDALTLKGRIILMRDRELGQARPPVPKRAPAVRQSAAL
jgi:hypothetical protein